VAWLNGLWMASGNLLIGYVHVIGADPTTGLSLVFHGIDANMRTDGRSVTFETSRRRKEDALLLI